MKLSLNAVAIGYEEVLVRNINAVLPAGQIAVLLGKNGSGKSTLLKSIMKFIPLLSGSILFDDENIQEIPSNVFNKKVSIVLSKRPEMNPIRARDFILHGRYPYQQNISKLREDSERLFQEVVKSLNLENSINKEVSVLSDGNFQKVNIARALMQSTPLILLDEPLSHLDIHNQYMILEILQDLAKNHQKTIVFSAHDWNTSLQIADKLWLIKEGDFVAGNTEDVALQEDLIGYLSHPSYGFDYCLNQFTKNETPEKIKVEVVQDPNQSDKIFWLYKALGKANIEVVPESENKIIIKDKGFVLNKNSEQKNYSSITELIENLKE